MPERTDPTISAPALTESEEPTVKRRGRPATRVEMPPLPMMEMGANEKALQVYFIEAYRLDYPDMSQTDLILLHLASLEYIKYLRVVAEELETGKVISQARQHPGVNMRALLDQMAVTRKARTAGVKASSDNKDVEEARRLFMDMGKAD